MRFRSALAALAGLGIALGGATSASADFGTGVGNQSASFDGIPEQAELWFDRAEEIGTEVFRVEVSWGALAPLRPAAATEPSSYDFSALRTQVARAKARGFDVMFTIWRAPAWAEAPGRPDWAPPGTWRPDPVALARFAAALTRAFDGFNGPRVRYYEVWNEPNLSLFLTPQWSGGRLIAAANHYRTMLNAFYGVAKIISPANQIIAAGPAPHGQDVGTGEDPEQGRRTRPLQFYRALMCLKRSRDEPAPSCPEKPRFDIAAIHPINRNGPPDRPPRHPDDVGPANAGAVLDAVRAAERARLVLPAGNRRPLWATEIWVETNPPDPVNGVAIPKAGRWMAQTLHLLWDAGVERAINYVIQDQALGDDGSGGEAFFVHGGIWHHPSVRGGEAKLPLYNAFRFPLVANRAGKGRVEIWGRAPTGGRLRVERRRQGGGWRKVATATARPWQVFELDAALPRGPQTLRARIGDERSATWKLGS